MPRIKHLLTFTRPLLIVLAGMTYTLGTGIARYLGRADSPLTFGLGFGWILLIVMAMNLLAVYFRPHNEFLIVGETIPERNWLRAAAFQLSIAALGVAAVLTVFILQQGISPSTTFFAVLILLAALAYALPPLRLVTSGFGELTLAILIAALVPAFAFTLQVGEMHRLLASVAFPLTALTLAALLVFTFPAFAEDTRYERRTLLTLMGWQRAVPLHHILVFSAYFLFATMPQFGIPWTIIAPVFLIMPFALFQIFWLQRISQGAPPNWKFVNILAITVLGLTTYLLTITFWIR